MKLIVGLGNPEDKYRGTRHNAGFVVINSLADNLEKDDFKFENKFKAEIQEIILNGEKTLLVKPQTFMNNSGESVKAIVDFYKLDPEKDVLIIYDDVDLPLGKYRTSGESSGGHKGMQSIINHLSTSNLKRIRVGITPTGIVDDPSIITAPTEKFVLRKFSKDEQKTLDEVILKIVDEIKIQ